MSSEANERLTVFKTVKELCNFATEKLEELKDFSDEFDSVTIYTGLQDAVEISQYFVLRGWRFGTLNIKPDRDPNTIFCVTIGLDGILNVETACNEVGDLYSPVGEYVIIDVATVTEEDEGYLLSQTEGEAYIKHSQNRIKGFFLSVGLKIKSLWTK